MKGSNGSALILKKQEPKKSSRQYETEKKNSANDD
jgi:hypothetical protein